MGNEELLKSYLNLIEEGVNNPSSDELFHQILQRSETVLMLTDSNLATEMQMSRTTVNRWRSGTTTPMVLMRRSVYTWLKKRTSSLIKKFEKSNQNTSAISNKLSASQVDT